MNIKKIMMITILALTMLGSPAMAWVELKCNTSRGNFEIFNEPGEGLSVKSVIRGEAEVISITEPKIIAQSDFASHLDVITPALAAAGLTNATIAHAVAYDLSDLTSDSEVDYAIVSFRGVKDGIQDAELGSVLVRNDNVTETYWKCQ